MNGVMEKQNSAEDQTRRLTCRDEEGRPRLMPNVNLIDVIKDLCQIEERGMGVLITVVDFGGEFVPFAERYPDVKKPK